MAVVTVEVNGVDVVVESEVLEGMEEERCDGPSDGVVTEAVELDVDGVVTLVVCLELPIGLGFAVIN